MTNALTRWYRTLTDIRREEVRPVVLMLLYGFLVLTSYYVVKPARNAVFVDRVGTDGLPFVYIATAIVVSIVMIGYSRWVHRVGHMALLLGTFAFLGSNLVAFRWLLQGEGFVTSGVFYIWGKLYPLLLVSQFWLVANLLFDTRQAKRLFGPIGVGLILGGIAGSTIAGTAAESVGTENLLLLAAGVLGMCAGIVVLLRPEMGAAQAGPGGRLVGKMSGDAFKLLKDSSHLRMIAVILGMTIVVSTLVDWEFNRAVEQSFPTEDGKTAFYGTFFAVLNIVSVTIQILFTSFVLRRFGVGVALLVLPVGLLVASAGVFLIPILLTATLAKGTEGALRYSLDQSTRELLYLPVPVDVKYKVKPLIDLAVYRGGTGVGGVILLVLVNVLGLGMRTVAVASVVLIGVWAFATFRMRREFKDSVKRLIGVRDVRLDDLVVQRMDRDVVQELRDALQGGDEEGVLYSLGLVQHQDPRTFRDELVDLLRHDAVEVRIRCLSLLRQMGHTEAEAEARALLVDPDLGVRTAALEYLIECHEEDRAAELRRYLEDEEYGIRAAAISLILRSGSAPGDGRDAPPDRATRALEALSEAEELEARVYAAQALVNADPDSEPGQRVMRLLLKDPDPRVRHAAMATAGQAGSREFVPILLERVAGGRDRDAAIQALSLYGGRIQGTLVDHLGDPSSPRGVRLAIPRILLRDADQRTATLLVESLHDASPQVRFEILKTLGKLRRDRDDLEFERYDVEPIVRREAEEAYLWATRRDAVGAGEEGSTDFLHRILEQRMEDAAERAFRALGLAHDLEDLQASFQALRSQDPVMRHRGFELLENALPRSEREIFDPLLDPDATAEARTEAARDRYGIEVGDRADVLETLAGGDEILLSHLAERALGRSPSVVRVTRRRIQEVMAPQISLDLETPELDQEVDLMDILEKAEALRSTRIFRELRGEELSAIATLVEEGRFREGDVIPEKSAAETDLFLILEGRLGAERDGRILYEAGPGEAFFQPAFLDGRHVEHDTAVLEDTHLLRLSRIAFMRLLEERFTVVRGLLNHLGKMVREREEGRETAAAGAADGRA